jgi:hypothetical protein
MNTSCYCSIFFLIVACFGYEGAFAAFQSQQLSSYCYACTTHRTVAMLSQESILTPEEERAAALSDYLAKSHEEKLRAIKEVETKKNVEIEQLQQQITDLKESRTSTSTSSSMVMVNGGDANVKALDDMNKDELLAKVVQYQNFMRQYMIDAQEQKYRAVQAAQVAAQKKLTESMTLLGLTSSLSNSATELSNASPVTPPLYAARNTAVAKAAAAGQSRWGNMEVQRVANVPTAHMSLPITSASSLSVVPLTATPPPLYAARSAAIAKAAAAGRSRWGSAEVQRVSSMAELPTLNGARTASTMSVNGGLAPVMKTATVVPVHVSANVPVPSEVAEADHGLRSDGSVGGMTLAQRVYYGAAPLSNNDVAPTSVIVPVPLEVAEADHGLRSDGSVGGLTLAERVYYGAAPIATTSSSSLMRTTAVSELAEDFYSQRNLNILKAAQAGHSRWGTQEIERVSNIVSTTSRLSPVTVEVPIPVVKQLQRVNFGAAILGQQ